MAQATAPLFDSTKRDRSRLSYPPLDFRYAPLATKLARTAIPRSLDAQRGSTLRQVGKFPPPVSGRLFSISVFDTRRPVRELAETGSWTAGRRSACPAARG
jgi:hypothetical protein